MSEQLAATSVPPVADRLLTVSTTFHSEHPTDAITAHDFVRCQLRSRYTTIALGSDALLDGDPMRNRLVLHTCASHLGPGGEIVSSIARSLIEPHAIECGFSYGGENGGATVWRRTHRRTIHDRVGDARFGLDRLAAPEVARLLAAEPTALVLDVRTPTDRETTGVIEQSIHTPRTVLEWRADPTSGFSHSGIVSFDQPLVVVCNEGYSSSLGAAALQDLGFGAVTDMVGGMWAWTSAGLPVVETGAHESGFHTVAPRP